jgi:hypothetical protein
MKIAKEEQSRHHGVRRHRLTTLIVAPTVLAGALIFGGAVVTPQSAQAVGASCGDGRCTITLNKGETWNLGQWRVPAPPPMPVQLRTAYYALAYGHVWFAQQYAKKGLCTAFRLDVRPWATQGYFAYSC